MAKVHMGVQLNRSQKPPKSYLKMWVEDLDTEEFETIRKQLKSVALLGYESVPPHHTESGIIIIDFEDMDRAREFIDFLAAEVGVQYNVDTLFVNKVAKIAQYENRIAMKL